MSEVEETLKRINSHKGVVGIVIANHEGAPIRSTLETAVAEQMSSQLLGLAAKARSAVRNLDPQNDLTFLRIRSKKHEILVAPEKVRFALHMRVAMSSSRAAGSAAEWARESHQAEDHTPQRKMSNETSTASPAGRVPWGGRGRLSVDQSRRIATA